MGKLHCLDVGCGDASVIISENSTFLVDCHNIENHAHLLPASKNIRAVFITHQHRDHYSGLDYLRKKKYSIQHLIYSPYDRRYGDNSVTSEEWDEFNSHRDYFRANGTALYTPYRQESFEKPYWTIDGLKFWMLGPQKGIATSGTRELHDACLVFRADLAQRVCTFTGDASDCNLNWIAKNTNNICNDILHASHHGSINGADLDFLKKCNINQTLISTACGVYKSVPDDVALKRYIDNTKNGIYRTDQGGTWTWTF